VVHLRNCIPPGMSRHVFTGCLGTLKAAGLYRGLGRGGGLALVRAASIRAADDPKRPTRR
jgi:hypothetical protein